MYEFTYISTGTIESILSDGANVNARNQEGRTPLHSAVNWKRSAIREEDVPVIIEIVELLLTNGADINARDNNGMTPLDIAQENDLHEVVELLRTYGAKE